MTAQVTIYPAKYYPIYQPYLTVGGWVVMYVSDRHTARDVDGGKVHKSRQNAYAKAKRLNDKLPQPLAKVLEKADTAEYEFDGYYVYVGEYQDMDGQGYEVSICKEALPPHEYQKFDTLDEVENYLDGSLGYGKGARKWQAVEPEQ